MSGFGSGPFGKGPFGHFNWSRQVLWRDLPPTDRQLDAEEGGGRLESFINSIRPSFDFLARKARNFGDLRDSDKVRTQFNERISVTVVSSQSNPNGRTIQVELDDPDPSDPFVPLGDASVGWVLEDAGGRTFTVNRVHKLDSGGAPLVDVVGRSVTPSVGAAILRPTSLIEFLGGDFGIEVDFHEPEGFQRSSVRNVVQWLDLKGVEKAYDVIGKIAGYRVVPLGLWRLTPPPPGIPANRTFEAPLGSGNFYTDLPPLRPVFDEVAADVIPLDHYCFEEEGTDWDALDSSVPSGTSLSDGIGYSMQGLTILSSTDLGSGRWRVRVQGDLSPIADIGHWFVNADGMPDSDLYIETSPQEVASNEWEFEVFAGSSPTFGSTLDINYECTPRPSCSYCRASVIRVEVTPEEVATNPDALLDGALTRITNKILQVVPAHVRLTDIVHVVSVQASLSIQALGATSRETSAFASFGYYYDIVPADVMAVDPPHVIATGTVSTVP